MKGTAPYPVCVALGYMYFDGWTFDARFGVLRRRVTAIPNCAPSGVIGKSFYIFLFLKTIWPINKYIDDDTPMSINSEEL